MFVKDVSGNLINLSNKDVILESNSDLEMYECVVMAVGTTGTGCILWTGTKAECEEYLARMVDHLMLPSDLRMIHEQVFRSIKQTIRPEWSMESEA